MTDKKVLTEEEFHALAKKLGPAAKEVETQWPDPINWDETPLVEAEVLEVEEVVLEGRKTRRATIRVGDAERSLWESASLNKLFTALKTGSKVIIQYTGMKPLSGGREQRQYRVLHQPPKG